MKYIIILGDGMADEPIEQLNGRTPLEAAEKPYMDMLAAMGRNGLFSTVPQGFHPGSEIANMTVLGYDVHKEFEGRGSLEAASIGVQLQPGEMAMRCNLICIADGKIKNHSAGHISNEEAKELIEFLQEKLGDATFTFHNGISYRHLLVMKGGDKRLRCTPPHDVPGTPFADVMVQAECPEAQATADAINQLILKSQELLKDHPVNLRRIREGKDPANSIWPWSPGYKPAMGSLLQKTGLASGSVISAVDLIKGIGIYAGLESIEVEGATGLYNTNYEGKAQAAIEALRHQDFVFLHVEASDEAGHEGDVELKVQTIESLDSRIIGPIFEEVSDWDEPVAIAVLPDHPTPCALRTHTNKPVPFVIYKPGNEADAVQQFDEHSAAEGAYGTVQGDQFMHLLIP
ncbi:MAG: cofactor-independent phosphoglycerate mutase [Paludibacteraceae bacterium]|nr:cofactor-independent phosphoglycerate mutase [Paludibacteraceae bacterium]